MVIFLILNFYYFITNMLCLEFFLADVSPLCLASPMQSYVTQHLFIRARFHWEVDGFQPSVKPLLGIPRRSYTRPYDVTLPFLLLLRLSGQSHTHRCVNVQLCKLQVPLCSSGVIVTGSSLHSWGRVCRHNSEDESSLETDTVNFRTVVALERVVACCTYECSY